MSKKFLLSLALLSATLFAACQPNPTKIDSTSQPRDKGQTANRSGANHSTMNSSSPDHGTGDSHSSESHGTNTSMSNQGSTSNTEPKRESRTNTGG